MKKQITEEQLEKARRISKYFDLIIKELDLPKDKWSNVGILGWSKNDLRDDLRIYVDGESKFNKHKKWWEFWK